MPPDSDRLIEAALARIDETGAPADRILKDVLRRNPHLDDAGRRRVSLGVHGVRCLEGRLVHRLRALGRPTDPAHRWAAYRVDRLGEDAALGLEPGRWARLGWPTDPVGRLSAEASLPPWLAQRWIAAYGAASAMRLEIGRASCRERVCHRV